MNHKKITIGVVITLTFLVIIAPFIANFFVYSNVIYIEKDSGSWLSFYGAIWGGLIGGLLTLAGVMLTITYQNKSNFIKSYPRLKIKIDEIIKEINEINDDIILAIGYEKYHEYTTEITSFLNKEKNLLEKSVELGGEIFDLVHGCFLYTEKISYQLKYAERTDEMGGTYVDNTKVNASKVNDNHLILKLFLDELKHKREELDTRYNKESYIGFQLSHKDREIKKYINEVRYEKSRSITDDIN